MICCAYALRAWRAALGSPASASSSVRVDAAEDDPVAGVEARVPRRREHADVGHARAGGRQRPRPRRLRADGRGQTQREHDRVAVSAAARAGAWSAVAAGGAAARKRCEGDDRRVAGVVGAGSDRRRCPTGGDERGRGHRPQPVERSPWRAMAQSRTRRSTPGPPREQRRNGCSVLRRSRLGLARRPRRRRGPARSRGRSGRTAGSRVPHSHRRSGARCVAARSTSSSSTRRRSSSTSS